MEVTSGQAPEMQFEAVVKIKGMTDERIDEAKNP
jgi:hypothetical protein